MRLGLWPNLMQLRKHHARFAGCLMSAALVALGSACKPQSNPKAPPADARLQSFFTDKEQQARELSRADGSELPPLMKDYFAAAARGDWRSLSNAFEKMVRGRAPADGRTPDRRYHTAAWQPVAETYGTWELLNLGNEKFPRAFGQGIIDSLPAGCVYFGGTDPGRFMVCFLMKSQRQADPFFVVTQNQFADGTYLTYLESMFAGKLYTPSTNDSQRCFDEYMKDAQARMTKGQLRPGEDVRTVNGRVQVSGQVAVMAINGLLAKVIFDQNPKKRFFVEESFPLEWMYPHLTPHALIMEINREPLAELPESKVQKDHDFWSKYCGGLIGDWITYDTPVTEIAAFAERVYLKKNYQSFQGDPAFARDIDGQKQFSKLRSSIAGLYAWRFNELTGKGAQQYEQMPAAALTPEQKRVLDSSRRMTREAEFAFKQSYALCPQSPEALYRYVQLLAGARRFDEAVLLARTSSKLEPANGGLNTLIIELERLKAQPGGGPPPAGADAGLQKLEAAYRANPTSFPDAFALAQSYASTGRTGDVIRLADELVANPKSDGQLISLAAQVCQQLNDYPRLEKALARWTVMKPTPEAWLDYAAAQAVQKKTTEALASLQQALALNTARLKANSLDPDIAAGLKQDPRFVSLRDNPDFQKLIPPNQ